MREPDVALELRFGHARLLEVELVELRVVGPGHDGGRTNRASRPVRHAQSDDRAEAIGAQQSRVPGDGGAPVVASDHGRLLSKAIEQAHHVTDEVEQRVLIDRLGPIGLAVPAHVGCHRMEPGVREGPKLVAPGIPGLREAMAENDQGARPLLGDVHSNTVRFDAAVLDLAHGSSSATRILS